MENKPYITGLSDGRYGYQFGSGWDKSELRGTILDNYTLGYEKGSEERRVDPEKWGRREKNYPVYHEDRMNKKGIVITS